MKDFNIEEVLNKMTLKEKIGQLLVVGFHSPYYDEQARTLIEEYKVGNIIIFSRNFKDVKQLRELNKELYDRIIDSTGVIPFLCCDQEGGNVVRIDKEVAYPPMAMTLAASYDSASFDSGKVIGDELIRLGFNLDLAPVVDINSNINNPVMNVRTFGDNKEKVTKCGKDFINGLSEYGVIGCLKHFPSYGAVDVDPHKGLPINHDSLRKLLSYDLYPYKHIKNADLIMSAHLIYTSLDKDNIATLSPKNYELLRQKIGYKGLVMTDCLEMDAVVTTTGTQKGALMALKAGADLLCICHTLERQVGAIKEIEKAVLENRLSIEEIDDRVRRILQVKKKTIDSLNKYFFDKRMLILKKSEAICQRIVDHSITKVKGKIDFSVDTLIVAPKSTNFSLVEDCNEKKNLAKNIKDSNPNYQVVELTNDSNCINRLHMLKNEYQHIIFFTYVGSSSEWQIKLVNDLAKTNQVDVFSLKGPFDYYKYQNIKNYMCVYEYTEHSIKTIIKYINNEVRALGKLPIKIE